MEQQLLDLTIRLQLKETEFDEYQQSSREYEQELEAQLTAYEKKNRELLAANQRLQIENSNLKSKLGSSNGEFTSQIVQLKKELNEAKITNEKLNQNIRELEQYNDDLERTARVLSASVEDYELRLNSEIEKNVLLENDLADIGPAKAPKSNGDAPPSERPTTERSTEPPSELPVAKPQPVQPILSPATRISALNVVSDLLRKVGALESKLASCRNLVPPGTPGKQLSPVNNNAANFNNSTTTKCSATTIKPPSSTLSPKRQMSNNGFTSSRHESC